ncbi:MAG: hypothetical protein LVR00_01860 [Rhabdochlamydiaceae bacterium]
MDAITTMVKENLGNMTPQLPADQQAALAANILDEIDFEAEPVLSVFPENAVDALFDQAEETLDALVDHATDLQNQLNQSQELGKVLVNRCTSLETTVVAKDTMMTQMQEQANATIQGLRSELGGAQDLSKTLADRCATLEVTVTEKDTMMAQIQQQANAALNHLRDGMTSMQTCVVKAQNALSFRLNIIGICLVAFGAICLSVAYCYKPSTQGSHSESRNHDLYQRINKFIQIHHTAIMRAGLALTTLGICCLAGATRNIRQANSCLALASNFR